MIKKTVHYPLFTQNDLPSPEQETTFPPAHRTLSDKLLSTRQSQDAQRKPVPVLKMPLQSQDALEIAISRRGVVRAKRRQHTATLPDSVSTAPQRHHPWPSQSQSLLRSRSIRPCRTAPPPPSDHAELDPSKPDPAGEGPLRVVDHHALQDQS